jgi:azurin
LRRAALVVLQIMLCALLHSVAAAETTVLNMSVREGQLRYSIEAFTVKPGAQVEIKFHNNDHEMMHNIVICENTPGVVNEVGMAAVMLADKAEAKKYIPDHPSILLASDLVQAGETISFKFTAPKKEGPYPYVCTLPGHFNLMNGVMTVSSKEKATNSPLYNLTYKRYAELPKGANLDKFSTFPDTAEVDAEDGLLNLMIGNLDGNPDATPPFALEFSGQLVLPESGPYRFTLDMMGPVDIKLGDTTLFRNTNGRATIVRHSDVLELKRGIYPLTMKYLAYHGPVFRKRSLRANIKFVAKGPDGTYKLMTRDMAQPVSPPTTLVPEEGGVYVFRSAVDGSGPASVHVGYDSGLSYSFDTRTCRLTQAWTGGFLNAGGDWAGRGGHGSKIVGNRFYQVKENAPAFFVGSHDKPAKMVFSSYRLDDSGAPSFSYSVDGMPATLELVPKGQTLVQKITVANAGKDIFYLHDGKRQKLTGSGPNASIRVEVRP